MSLNHIFTTKVHIIIIFFLLLPIFIKKTCNDTREFIKLYEHSFRENWDLPCYTDYGENTGITPMEIVAQKSPVYICCSNIVACAAAIRFQSSAKTTLAGASPIWQPSRMEQSWFPSCRTSPPMMYITSSIIPNLYSSSPAMHLGQSGRGTVCRITRRILTDDFRCLVPA